MLFLIFFNLRFSHQLKSSQPCGIGAGSEYASIQVALLQNAMIIAGIVTLIQLFSIGPVGGKVPISVKVQPG